MKKFKSMFSVLLLTCVVTLSVVSCGKKDSDIQADVQKHTAGMGIQNVSTSVKDGVVTISGVAMDEAAKTAAAAAISGIKGVKSVVNNITVAPPPPTPAPVVIAADDPLKQSVTDATKDYPGVTASVQDGVITLTGSIKRSDLQNLMKNLNTLKPKKINNQLTIN